MTEAKKRRGRPRLQVYPLRRVSLSLDAKTMAAAKQFGGGNASLGIRRKFEKAPEPEISIQSEPLDMVRLAESLVQR